MKKIWLIFSIMLGAALAACGGAATLVPPAPIAVADTATAVPIPNTATAVKEKTPTIAQVSLPTSEPATCTVSSTQPTRTPDPYFPAPDPKTDWIEGPETAKVTFLEYSDFQ
jgi:hypothetical protein